MHSYSDEDTLCSDTRSTMKGKLVIESILLLKLAQTCWSLQRSLQNMTYFLELYILFRPHDSCFPSRILIGKIGKKYFYLSVARLSRLPEYNLESGHLVWDLEDLTSKHFMLVFLFFVKWLQMWYCLDPQSFKSWCVQVFIYPMRKNGEVSVTLSIIDNLFSQGSGNTRHLNAFLWEKDGILAVRRSNGIE